MAIVQGDRCTAPWTPLQLHTWQDGICIHCNGWHPDSLEPCECGCGKLAPHGMLEAAHPEDYRFGERGCS